VLSHEVAGVVEVSLQCHWMRVHVVALQLMKIRVVFECLAVGASSGLTSPSAQLLQSGSPSSKTRVGAVMSLAGSFCFFQLLSTTPLNEECAVVEEKHGAEESKIKRRKYRRELTEWKREKYFDKMMDQIAVRVPARRDVSEYFDVCKDADPVLAELRATSTDVILQIR